MKYLKEIGVKLLKLTIRALKLIKIIHTDIQNLDDVLMKSLEIDDEIQDLLKSQNLLQDIDLDEIIAVKKQSFVDYTVGL